MEVLLRKTQLDVNQQSSWYGSVRNMHMHMHIHMCMDMRMHMYMHMHVHVQCTRSVPFILAWDFSMV